jgi:L-aminopeptidase/D-esterase-like protein
VSSLGFGVAVGHWSDPSAKTGCTVLLPPLGNVSSCDIRGSSPSSREIELLHPDRRLTEIHGVLLTGGSAFGLAAADGVVSWLEEHGIGYDTKAARVPIVPGAVILDLGTGDAKVRPGPKAGRTACEGATETGIATGRVGAGTGATVGKWAGFEERAPGGLGIGSASEGGAEVTAIAVVNSVGDVIDDSGAVVAGTRARQPSFMPPMPEEREAAEGPPQSTVLAAVICSGITDKRDVRWIASRGSDGITVSVRPAHTRYDGDVVFAISAPGPEVSIDLTGYLATRAVAAAIRNAVSDPPA